MSRPMKPLTPIALGPLRVTPICLGAMTFGEQVGEADAHAILDRAVERGVTNEEIGRASCRERV